MKINTTLVAIMATMGASTALPEAKAFANAVGACGVPGNPCHKVKRAALAINDILKRHAEANPQCSEPGSFCEHQRNALDDIAESALDGYDDIVAREAAAEPRRHHLPFFSFCGAPGTPCWRKRDNTSEAELPSNLIAHCGDEGATCARKRDADPAKLTLVKRMSNCKICSFGTCSPGAKAFCKGVHHIKWRKKHPKEKGHKGCHVMMNGASVEKHCRQHKHLFTFCGMPGGGCGVKRDVSSADYAETMAPGSFGDTLYQIRDAVNMIKREAEDEKAIADPEEKLANCDQSRCSPLTYSHLYAPDADVEDNQESADELNDEIDAYFYEIESRANDAVAFMEADE